MGSERSGKAQVHAAMVSQHTQAVLTHVVPGAEEVDVDLLMHHTLARLQLWLLQRQLEAMQPDTLTQDLVNGAMAMLRSVTRHLGCLADAGEAVGELHEACSSAALTLRTLVAQQAAAVASTLQLDPRSKMEASQQVTFPEASLPAAPPSTPGVHAPGSQADALAHARSTLCSLPVLPADSSFQAALELMKNESMWPSDDSSVVRHHQVCSLEGLVFGHAVQLSADTAAAAVALDAQEVSALKVSDRCNSGKLA